MVMAKKGTRQISVDGILYRWRLAPNDGYMLLVVETADHCHSQLTAYFVYHDAPQSAAGGASKLFQRRIVSPGVVRQVILTALDRGWQPSFSGLPPFHLHDAEQLVPIDECD